MAEVLDLQVLADEAENDIAYMYTDGSGYSWNC